MKQPYFSRILADSGNDFEGAFRRNGHVHMGYYADATTGDARAQTFAAAADALVQRVFAAARIADGMRVLDVGCGLGGSLARLNEERSRVDLVGLNIDARQLDIARTRVKALPENRISFVEGDASRLPFADASFDALISIECVEHLPSRRQLFREARRVLRPGGRFCMADYIPQGWGVPFLAVLAPFLQPRLKSFYGDFNAWPCTEMGYRLIGRLADLREVENQETTRNMMPSFTALRKIFIDRDAARAIAAVEWLCRSGMLGYRVLTFV